MLFGRCNEQRESQSRVKATHGKAYNGIAELSMAENTFRRPMT